MIRSRKTMGGPGAEKSGSESPQGVADRLSGGSSSGVDSPPSGDDSGSDSTLTADSPKAPVERDNKSFENGGEPTSSSAASGPTDASTSKSKASVTAKASLASGAAPIHSKNQRTSCDGTPRASPCARRVESAAGAHASSLPPPSSSSSLSSSSSCERSGSGGDGCGAEGTVDKKHKACSSALMRMNCKLLPKHLSTASRSDDKEPTKALSVTTAPRTARSVSPGRVFISE